MGYEYTVIPAPTRGEKAKDAKTPTDRYALAVTGELNRMAKEGWEYIRADVLPSEERSGLTSRTTVYHNLLVFRREIVIPAASANPRRPQPEYPAAASPVRAPEPTPSVPDAAAPKPADHLTGPTIRIAGSDESEPAQPPAPRNAPGGTA